VPCGCQLENLLAILHDRAPAKADAVSLQRRRVEHGLLSVGLKIHELSDGSQFFSLVERLGGALRVLESNVYKHSQASLCLVLPPVGNARAAILLLECIEHFIGSALFGNRKIQIQVCSPGRLSVRRSALLAIGFYLGSDTLRRYTCGDLETTVSRDRRYQRGQRLVIYDAEGDFDRGFEWWERVGNGKDRLVRRQLPFENGRTDLLTGNGSRLDIKTSIFSRRCLLMRSTKAIGMSSAGSLRRRCYICSTGICLPVWSALRGCDPKTLKVSMTRSSSAPSKSWSRTFSKNLRASRRHRELFLRNGKNYRQDHPQASCTKCSRCSQSIALK
jgi:hypothetical protein